MRDLGYSVVPAWSRYVVPKECSQYAEKILSYMRITMEHGKFSFPYHVEVFIVDGGVFMRQLLFSSTMVLHGGHGEQLCALTSSR